MSDDMWSWISSHSNPFFARLVIQFDSEVRIQKRVSSTFTTTEPFSSQTFRENLSFLEVEDDCMECIREEREFSTWGEKKRKEMKKEKNEKLCVGGKLLTFVELLEIQLDLFFEPLLCCSRDQIPLHLSPVHWTPSRPIKFNLKETWDPEPRPKRLFWNFYRLGSSDSLTGVLDTLLCELPQVLTNGGGCTEEKRRERLAKGGGGE